MIASPQLAVLLFQENSPPETDFNIPSSRRLNHDRLYKKSTNIQIFPEYEQKPLYLPYTNQQLKKR
jgi:hypothetical protein